MNYKKINNLRIVIPIILFSVISIITIYSSQTMLSSSFNDLYIKQIIWYLIGFILVIFISRKKNQTNDKELSFDLDNSNDINYKEALLLGFALSLDSICIGIGGSTIGINIYFFSILVALLQYIFLSLGIFFGGHINKISTIPQNVWSKISGVLLILIGLLKF